MVLVRVRVRATRATGGQVSGGGGQTRSVWAQPWEAAAFRAGLVRKTCRGPRRSRTLGTDGLGGRLAARGGAQPAPREHVLSREAHSSMVSVGRTRCPPGRAPQSSPRRPQGWRVTPSGSGVPSRPAARARTVRLGCRRGGGDGGGEGAPGCAAGVPRSGEPMGRWHRLRGQGGRRSRGTPLAS